MLWVPVSRLVPSWAIAQTWGLVVLYEPRIALGLDHGEIFLRKPHALTIHHEDRHAGQWSVLGPLFPIAYGIAHLAAGGYRNNWFERDARDYAEKALVDNAIQS